jgi:hypothetical protein
LNLLVLPLLLALLVSLLHLHLAMLLPIFNNHDNSLTTADLAPIPLLERSGQQMTA